MRNGLGMIGAMLVLLGNGPACAEVVHYGCWGGGDVGYEVVLDTEAAGIVMLHIVGGYDMTEDYRHQEMYPDGPGVWVNREFWFDNADNIVMAQFGMLMFPDETIQCDPALVEVEDGSLMPYE